MTIRLNKPEQESDIGFDFQALLHPAGAFSHPTDVVRDPDLTLSEKRAILASWASDACAVESAPALRIAPAGSKPVTFDDVMDVLRALDEQAEEYGAQTAPSPLARQSNPRGLRPEPATRHNHLSPRADA